jgi:hypothetical protein
MRRISSIWKGLENKHGIEDDEGWSADIEGAAGEMAAAKALNLYCSHPVNTFKGGADVGEYEIRTTSKSSNKLIVRDRDDNDRPFVLVTGTAPHFTVHGWIMGKDAKQEKWKKAPNDRPPAWFVPQSSLHAIDPPTSHS